MLAANSHKALLISIAVTLLALTVFGFVKGHFTGVSKFKSAWQTALVGRGGRGFRHRQGHLLKSLASPIFPHSG
ncbi:MAG: VIT1/CCC1 transporter family protein [Chthoniobacteraceae bacterium]